MTDPKNSTETLSYNSGAGRGSEISPGALVTIYIKLYKTLRPSLAWPWSAINFDFVVWNSGHRDEPTWGCGEGDMNLFQRLEPFENNYEAEIVGPSSVEQKHHKEVLGRFC